MAPTSPHGRVYGVSCKPTPPRHPTDSQLWTLTLTLTLILQVQGCKPCRPHTPHTTGMLCCPNPRYGGVDMIISASE